MLKQRKTKTATIWTLSPGKRVATVSAQLEDDRWIVYCGNVRISPPMRHLIACFLIARMDDSQRRKQRRAMKHHPEQQDDEIYMGNEYVESLSRSRGSITKWKTLRFGDTSYDRSGNVQTNHRPMFIKRSEVEAAIGESQDGYEKRIFQEMLDRGRIS